MTRALAPARTAGQSLLETLSATVRPGFAGEVIRIDPDDPVFARGRCGVDGCERGAWSRLVCSAHYNRWRRFGKPDLDAFVATTGPIRLRSNSRLVDVFDLRALPTQLRLEIAYSIQCRHDDRAVRLLPTMISGLIDLVTGSGVDSLLDLSPQRWTDTAHEHAAADCGGRTIGQLRYALRHLRDLADGPEAETEFAGDVWRAGMLGIAQTRPPHQIRFDGIDQPWLRKAVKRCSRYRLGAGKSFGTVSIDERALRWFSTFLTEQHPEVTGASGITRQILEHYLSWLAATSRLSGNTTNTYLVVLRGFLDACHRHRWLPGLPSHAAIYLDELPSRPRPLPRFIPEFVMAQLENPDNLSRLPDETTRHLLVLIMETGLRANDACALPLNPLIADSVGWPCLKFFNTKMAREQLIPLSQKAADAIGAQQTQLLSRWPSGCARLFPSPHANPDGVRSFSYATLSTRLAHWQKVIDLRDETGQAVRVTAHQFRHTVGTRLINAGVPQHVVQQLLGHASPQMTARYATIHDTTVRAAFDDYQRRRVDIGGQRLDFDPDAPTADAEWVKHNLARVQASLPNGYCGRPPQQDCPHPNACLTCPDFQTTPNFLPLHIRQRDDTLELIDLAERRGNARLAANHRQVATNLQHVIDALEALEEQEHH
ncbi:tyrosine-type recombinase/integrase [Rhodococcus sp. IEGM 1307]|uniref:tyrosine-type recombinase/integrase n=1 Tax=Rhodococcus sp. IEGM 1307 TaxID=3047091 RepID=UPI0024B80E14|nr:tyrosine-type recombinase/integrase [Rhodococcus sp. IEGM 1307]MDI9977390.1 tyrosine-type recombinase/integrase [Rhodococcus sp. IEGM 1307]